MIAYPLSRGTDRPKRIAICIGVPLSFVVLISAYFVVVIGTSPGSPATRFHVVSAVVSGAIIAFGSDLSS